MFNNVSNMSMFAGCEPVEHNGVIDPEYVPTDSDMDRILKAIYSVDEKSGLPQGDLAFYLSPDGNPQIKSWLENNLLKPRAAARGTSVEGVTDDMIAEYAKGSNESAEDYSARLKKIYDDTSAEIQKFKDSQHE